MTDQAAPDIVFARTIAWLMRVQALLIVAVGVLFIVISGVPMMLAALAGGAVGLLLTALTGLRVALSQGDESRQMVRAFYRAMALKFVLTVVLFIVVAVFFAAYFVPVLVGYAATLAAYWPALLKLSVLAKSNT